MALALERLLAHGDGVVASSRQITDRQITGLQPGQIGIGPIEHFEPAPGQPQPQSLAHQGGTVARWASS
jgi:hypothetical protein